ncbi:MAG: aminoacyl-tRNA hydrolase [Patescibacteria group bacterium]
MRLIVGLGNPGEQYKNTRHNVGWLTLDQALGNAAWRENKKFRALIYEDGDYLFVKPLTFMNESGQTVQKILDYYGLRPKSWGLINKRAADLNEVLTVVHDDLDLNFGDYRIATDSGSAGHNGVQSIIKNLKTQKFTRLRLGIKNDLLKTHIPPDKFVLSPFDREERQRLPELLGKFDIKNLK